MNMEESSDIKLKQNRLNKQVKKKEKTETDKKKTPKQVGNVEKEEKSDEIGAEGHDEGLKKPKRKLRKPTAEEDIIDGFAILAFKNYEELSRAIQLGEHSDSRLCVQLLRRAEDGSVCKSAKAKKIAKTKNSPPKIQFPKPKSTPNKKKCTVVGLLKCGRPDPTENSEKMANKLPQGSGGGSKKKKRSSESGVENSKKKQRSSNVAPSSTPTPIPSSTPPTTASPTATKEELHKVLDDCTDLFVTTPKDSSPGTLDNLHSSPEQKGLDPQVSRISDEEENEVRSSSPTPTVRIINPTSSWSTPTTATSAESSVIFSLSESKPKVLDPILLNSHTNGLVTFDCGSDNRDINGSSAGNEDTTPEILAPSIPLVPSKKTQQKLFTPYAPTGVSTPVGLSGSTVADIAAIDPHPINEIYLQGRSGCNKNFPTVQQSLLSDFTLSGSHIHRSSSSPHSDKTGAVTSPNAVTSSTPPRRATTPTGKETLCTIPRRKSNTTAFGSIARLLHSPHPSSSGRNSPNTNSASTIASRTQSTNHNNNNQFDLSGSGGPVSSHLSQSSSSRSLSPRSQSPPHERESYSNVSSQSRTSVTPLSGSSSLSQLLPNLSPLQCLSYSNAATWLSGVAPGLSPGPRPTPPPTALHPGSTGYLSNSGIPSIPGTTPSPLSFFPGLVSGPTPPSHVVPPTVPISVSSMFGLPMLPLSSIMSHPSSQPVPFGSPADSLLQGQASSELVRRDLESRFLGPERMGTSGGPGQFLPRPGELHPYHQQILSQLSAGSAMSPHNQSGTNTALFTPPMFKDLKMDSSLYRSLGLAYPDFNGILQPPPNLATPVNNTPSQHSTFTQKKAGRWNAIHVRIAWEIYQHQQKGGSDKNNANSSSTLGPPSSPTKSSAQIPTTSHSTDLLRPPNHIFSGLKPPEGGPSPFASTLLSPHQSPHRGNCDPSQHSLFLHSSQHLAPPLARYPSFGGLGPTLGGLSGLGSNLFGRDMANSASMSAQEQWQRMQRGAPYSAGIGQWSIPRPEREGKMPMEFRRDRAKEEREEKRHSDSIGSRGDSPHRDRSPVRLTRPSLENGDTDSRSSRSSDSHSTTVHSSKPKFKDESNGDREKPGTPHQIAERERERSTQMGSKSEIKSLNYTTGTHPPRLFHPGSPITQLGSGWDSFAGFNPAGSRMSSTDSFRLSLLQLNEREREYSARISTLLRPHCPNGPFMNLQLGGLGQLPSHPPLPVNSTSSGSNDSSNHSSAKNSPLGGPVPLNPSILSHHQQFDLHHTSSQNGSTSLIAKADERGKNI